MSSLLSKDKPKVACLIDGEHYLSNIQQSLHTLSKDYHISYLLFIGGTEKIGTKEDILNAFSCPVYFAVSSSDHNKPDYQQISYCLEKFPVDIVLDLSDEPIMDYNARFQMASRVLFHGAVYKGADFEFQPVHFRKILKKTSLAIWGTGKRIGKTAFGGYIARVLKKAGLSPGIVTLSRGGPKSPIVVRGDKIPIDLSYLLDIHRKKMHASSDCFEDALTAGVPTFGCRRCGAGMTGKTFVSLVHRGAQMAEKAPFVKTVIIEGSGASVPDIKTDKVVLLMNATQALEILKGYLTPYRILLADLIVLTMCEDFLVSESRLNRLLTIIREINPSVRIATTVLRPYPLGQNIRNKRIFFATTAPSKSIPFLSKYLEKRFGCRVVATSNHLSLIPQLRKDFLSAQKKKIDLVGTELKAAAISVVALEARKKNLPVVFFDNSVEVVPRGGDVEDLEKEILSFFK